MRAWGDGLTFHHDSDQMHTAKTTLEWFKESLWLPFSGSTKAQNWQHLKMQFYRARKKKKKLIDYLKSKLL